MARIPRQTLLAGTAATVFASRTTSLAAAAPFAGAAAGAASAAAAPGGIDADAIPSADEIYDCSTAGVSAAAMRADRV